MGLNLGNLSIRGKVKKEKGGNDYCVSRSIYDICTLYGEALRYPTPLEAFTLALSMCTFLDMYHNATCFATPNNHFASSSIPAPAADGGGGKVSIT